MLLLTPISNASNLTAQQAAHLLRRTTFGPTKSAIDAFALKNIDQALTDLLTVGVATAPPLDTATNATWVTNGRDGTLNSKDNTLRGYIANWWLHQMHVSSNSLQSKMIFWMHSHFTTAASVASNSSAQYHQLDLFRYYALGNFKTLAKKICLDNAMMRYLDNDQNFKDSINENFAREFLELYTIGKGPQIGAGDYTNFTEQDVQAAAEVLSGYKTVLNFSNLDGDTNIPAGKLRTTSSGGSTVANQHHAGTKTFSQSAFAGATIQPATVVNGLATEAAALQELDDLINLLFNQVETAKHICRKLYRYFVYHDITTEVEQDIITPLATTFQNSGYELQPVLEQLLKSQHFFDTDDGLTTNDNLGAIIKSPVEFALGTLRLFEVPIVDPSVNLSNHYEAYKILKGKFELQGLTLYDPFEVAGYPAYHQAPSYQRNWVTANYLANRYQLTAELINGISLNDGTIVFKIDIIDFVENNISNAFDADILLDELLALMLPLTLDATRRTFFRDTIFLNGFTAADWNTEWTSYQATMNDSSVRTSLETLLTAILQSPEYQLH